MSQYTMDVLKIATAGSVDDGKSTLIGRLLYDTKSLTTDKLAAIEEKSKTNGYDYLDFSLATDGLVAEREQGITIDVAHIYFSTENRSYIIADTPGHIEYTRNMVTGASTSQASIILIDARHGVSEQTYRHFFINNLLRVSNVIVAVNKMDLVNYSESVFTEIKQSFNDIIEKSSFKSQQINFVPISALKGDNVAKPSEAMSWCKGETVLNTLEKLQPNNEGSHVQPRFPVQYVIRPKTEAYHDYRGYAGKVKGGSFRVGDSVMVMPSGTISKIEGINQYDTQYEEALSGASVSITLLDDINISRGDMLVKVNKAPKAEKQLSATLSWMDANTLQEGSKYVLQHGVNKVLAKVKQINHKIEPDFSGQDNTVKSLKMNDLASVSLQLNKPIYSDAYTEHKQNGAFILIDQHTNNTAAVGFIE